MSNPLIVYSPVIDKIMTAVLNEARAFLQAQTFMGNPFSGTVILESDYKSDHLLNYAMPLLLIDMMDDPEESQYPGGVTRMSWVFGFNSYNHQPDSYVDDDSGYGPALLGIVDIIRQHFTLRDWTVPPRPDNTVPMSMQDVMEAYDFIFTLSGLTRANKLEQDGLVMGWRIMLDSMALDYDTDFISLDNPDADLEHIAQVNNPPFDGTDSV